MSTARTPEQWLERIPGWKGRPVSIDRLSAGFSHRSFLVESGGYRYVLRTPLDSAQVEEVRFDREYRLQQQAARRGLAPPVLYAEPKSGVMLTEYRPGIVSAEHDLRDRGVLHEIAELLRRLHELPPSFETFNAVGAAAAYVAAIKGSAETTRFAQRCFNIVEAMPEPAERRFCHNDVVAENLVRGHTLQLIDFEFAADNDPLFDLASIIGWHDLTPRESDWLLTAYVGSTAADSRDRLQQQLRLFDALQWLWLAEQRQSRPEASFSKRMARVEARIR